MKINIHKKVIALVYLTSIFVFGFFIAPQNTLAADCIIKQATFSPSGTQAESWYLDANKPDVTINISTTNCEGKTIDVSVAEEDWGIANDDDLSNSGLDEKPIVVPTSNSVTIHLKAGEEECEKYGTIGDDCEYIIYVDNPDTGTYSSDDKPNGNLRYECDGPCLGNWIIDSINRPVNLPPTTAFTNTETNYKPLAPLPDGSGGMLESIDTFPSEANPCPFGKYLNIMIKLIIGFAAVMAMVMIVMGGIEYMTSELVSSKEAGKETIQHAILGLLIALASYMILNTINPQLLSVCLDKLPKAEITIIENFEIFGGLTFDGQPIKVNFKKEAYPAAKAASQKTGINTAFILAVFAQETSSGTNTGSCTWKTANMGAGELDYLKKITKDWDTVKVSCSGGASSHGGAIGFTQFLPSTWYKYRDKAAAILGHQPSAWNTNDALMMEALLLKDIGGINNEKEAACKYFSGKSCNTNAGINNYGNSVMGKKISIQQQIDAAIKKGEIN